MSVIAIAVKHLIAAGVTGDALVTAIAEMEDATKKPVSAGAERTRRWREKKANECHGDITVTVGDAQKGFDKEKSPAPPKEITSKNKNTGRASRLPDDFEPDGSCWQIADELRLTTQQSQDAFDQFRDYWRAVPGGKGLKLDWQATFRNWLRRTAQDLNKGKPNGSTRQKPSIRDSFAVLDAVADEAIRRAGGLGPQGREEDSGEFPGLRQSAA